MEKHLLSKSTFIRGTQCLKSLYLYKNRYFLRDRLSPEQRAKFQRGTDVGVFAQNLFPGGINCQPKSPSQYRKSVEKTGEIIQSNASEVIYEAAFQYDRVLILLDILAKQDGKWFAYEVKSSLKISETYLKDAALQYYIMTNSGVEIEKFFLVHINPDYLFEDTLKIDELFKFVDVTSEARQRQDFVKQHIELGKEALRLKKSPPISIGLHCNNPYPCDFIGHCWKHIPPRSIFDLSQWSESEKMELYAQGIIKIENLPAEAATDPQQKAELQAYQNKKPRTDEAKLAAFLAELKPSVSFVSFLAHRKAIPAWNKFKPFDLVPVSLSVKKSGDENITTFYNSTENENPDSEFCDFLKTNIAKNTSLILYDGSNFIELLERLAQRNPEMEEFLSGISQNIIDLKTIFQELIYINPKLGNNFSLANSMRVLFDENILKKLPFTADTLAINEYTKPTIKSRETPVDEESIKKYTSLQTELIARILAFFNTQ